jgi:hypothetical protein
LSLSAMVAPLYHPRVIFVAPRSVRG